MELARLNIFPLASSYRLSAYIEMICIGHQQQVININLLVC